MKRRCSKCTVSKEPGEFHPSAKSGAWCKFCMSEYYKRKSYSKTGKDKQVREDLDNGNRLCNKCKEEKTLEEFPKNKKCKGGRERTCSVCLYKSRNTKERKANQKRLGRKWYEENREHVLKMGSERYQKDKERLQAYGRQHAKDNPNIYKAAFHRRRAQINTNGRNDLTAKQIAWMFENFPYCVYCEAEGDLTVDHVMPISKGGENTLDNVVPACGTCNSKKRAKVLQLKPSLLNLDKR